ncbi:MAG TPA: hypothetical protein PLZ86_04255 [bacterium]|nr:hypothetical protein [bacterium]
MNMKVGHAGPKQVGKAAEEKPAEKSAESKTSRKDMDDLMAGLARDAYLMALKKNNQARRDKSGEVFIDDLGGGKIDVRLTQQEFSKLCEKLPNPEALYPMQHFNESGYRVTQSEGEIWIEMQRMSMSEFIAEKAGKGEKQTMPMGGPSALNYFKPARTEQQRHVTKTVNRSRLQESIEQDEAKVKPGKKE